MKKALLVVIPFLLVACGNDTVPQDIVDQNQIISQRNVESNLRAFAAKRYPDNIRTTNDSDSTIGPDCRFGDGWGSGRIYLSEKKWIPVMCQTNGRGKGFSGCLEKRDFLGKPYAKEDGRCSGNIKELKKFK